MKLTILLLAAITLVVGWNVTEVQQVFASGETTSSILNTSIRRAGIRRSGKVSEMRYGVAKLSNQGIIIIRPQSREQIFFASGLSSSGVYYQNPGSLAVINGAYFIRDGVGGFRPAGVWTTGERALDPSICQDQNLCDVYNLHTLALGLFPTEGWFTGAYRSSGPILLQSGVANPAIFKNYSHRQRKTYRTIMIPQGPFFILTTKGYTLPQMAEFITKNFGKVDAINLDGGSSSSFYSPKLKRNIKAHLPEFIVLK